MNKIRKIIFYSFSVLFVCSVFAASLVSKYAFLFILLAVLFSLAAILSVLLPQRKTVELSNNSKMLYAALILSAIAILTDLFFIIRTILGLDSIEMSLSIPGFIVNSLLFVFCTVNLNKNLNK